MYGREVTVTVLTHKPIRNKVTGGEGRGDTAGSERRDVYVARERRFSDERHRALPDGGVPLLIRHMVHVDDVAQVLLSVLALHCHLLVALRVRRELAFELRRWLVANKLALHSWRTRRHRFRLGRRPAGRV